jgi:DNA processing protein
MDLSELELAWLRLALADGVGPAIAARLVERLGGVCEVARASLADLRAAAGPVRSRALHAALRATRPEAVARRAAGLGQSVLTPPGAGWPTQRLAALPDPPLALFLRGRLPPADPPAVAVVGTREAGHPGLSFARGLAEALARDGLWIVSGLALGIDGAAHAGALLAGRAGTLAVLGCGVDVPYPEEHLDLKEQIVARGGGLLSEHAPGTPAQPGHFPRRNRLVAALAAAVVVVEAPARSGALITARLALDMGREVLAAPGPAGRAAWRGSHGLLKRGEAALCDGWRDVLAALGQPASGQAAVDERPPPASGAPLAVWGVIDETEAVAVNEICRRTGLLAGDVATALARLELDGRVARVPGVGFRRV